MAVKPSADRSIDDLAHGQVVLVTARWILVATSLFLTLWNPGPLPALRLQITFMLLLAFANFYLNLELFRKRPLLKAVVYGASAADLLVITLYVLSQGGFVSNAFIFYFPALLAMSVAFPGVLTALFSGSAIGFYFLVAFFALLFADNGNIATADFQALIARILMLTAVAFCGYMYRRIEQNRRLAAEKAQEELVARVRERSAVPS
jgi:hypothetical protein